MKTVKIKTTFKDGIKDNQAEAVLKCLHQIGYSEVTSLKMGCIYTLSIEHEDNIDEIAKAVSNEIMENSEIIE